MQTTTYQPIPELLAARERDRREREREKTLWHSALHRSHDPGITEAQVRAALGAEARVVGEGRLDAWEAMAERAHAAQRVRPVGDLDVSPYFDPDDLGNENQALNTPDAVPVARLDRRR